MTREPQCIQWKRVGARKVQEMTDSMTAQQELSFWEAETKKLREKQRQNIDHSRDVSIAEAQQ